MRAEDRLQGAAPEGPVDAAPVLGTWWNTDKATAGVVRLELRNRGGALHVQAFGAGEPDPYDWGEIAGIAYAASPGSRDGIAWSAVYDFGFAETILAAYTKSGILVLDTFNTFKDGSGRSNYFTREFFHR